MRSSIFERNVNMVGKRLKEIRLQKGLSQQELGNMIGVTKVSICGYENGTRVPTIDNLVKLADNLDITIDYLLGREVTVMNEENKSYIGSISYEDVCFIMELRHYPNLYSKLLNDWKRSANLINKKLMSNKK